MYKNLDLENVVPASVSLADKEGYCVDTTGTLLASTGAYARGVVYEGRAANEASVIAVRGQISAKVDGSHVNVAAGDPLVGSSVGKLVKATISTHADRGHVLEAVTTDTDALVWLI